MRRLALGQSPRFNAVVVAAATLLGLCGVAAFVPWWGVVFVMILSTTLRLVVFLQSHYLNQLVDSGRRATVLSLRGLAVNVAYGLTSLAFSGAVAAVERATAAAAVPTEPAAGTMAAFRTVVALLPVCFVVACLLFAAWSRRRLGGELTARGRR